MDASTGTFARLRIAYRAGRLIPEDAFARLVAAGATSALLLGLVHALLASGPRVLGPAAPVIEAVFLPPPSLPIPSPPPPIRIPLDMSPVPSAPRAAPTPDISPSTSAQPGAHHGAARSRLDYGSLLGAGEPIAFAERLPGQRDSYGTPFEARPERFRMRRQITPEDVVRGFAQLVGLWPPGYTDSPCPAIRRLIEMTPERPSPRDLELLQDAVLAREQFCS